MGFENWTNADVDERLQDAKQQLDEAQSTPGTDPQAIETIKWNIGWLESKKH